MISATRKKGSTMVELIAAFMPSPGRLIQVGLALYLLPALLAVLAVGALGTLILAARGLLFESNGPEVSETSDCVGLEIFRS
jgi:hypothetical protein